MFFAIQILSLETPAEPWARPGRGADGEVNDHGAVVDFQGSLNGGIHILVALATESGATVCFTELHEVGDACGAVTVLQVGVGVSARCRTESATDAPYRGRSC